MNYFWIVLSFVVGAALSALASYLFDGWAAWLVCFVAILAILAILHYSREMARQDLKYTNL